MDARYLISIVFAFVTLQIITPSRPLRGSTSAADLATLQTYLTSVPTSFSNLRKQANGADAIDTKSYGASKELSGANFCFISVPLIEEHSYLECVFEGQKRLAAEAKVGELEKLAVAAMPSDSFITHDTGDAGPTVTIASTKLGYETEIDTEFTSGSADDQIDVSLTVRQRLDPAPIPRHRYPIIQVRSHLLEGNDIAAAQFDEAGKPVIVLAPALSKAPQILRDFVYYHEMGHHVLLQTQHLQQELDTTNDAVKQEWELQADLYAVSKLIASAHYTEADLLSLASYLDVNSLPLANHPSGKLRAAEAASDIRSVFEVLPSGDDDANNDLRLQDSYYQYITDRPPYVHVKLVYENISQRTLTCITRLQSGMIPRPNLHLPYNYTVVGARSYSFNLLPLQTYLINTKLVWIATKTLEPAIRYFQYRPNPELESCHFAAPLPANSQTPLAALASAAPVVSAQITAKSSALSTLPESPPATSDLTVLREYIKDQPTAFAASRGAFKFIMPPDTVFKTKDTITGANCYITSSPLPLGSYLDCDYPGTDLLSAEAKAKSIAQVALAAMPIGAQLSDTFAVDPGLEAIVINKDGFPVAVTAGVYVDREGTTVSYKPTLKVRFRDQSDFPPELPPVNVAGFYRNAEIVTLADVTLDHTGPDPTPVISLSRRIDSFPPMFRNFIRYHEMAHFLLGHFNGQSSLGTGPERIREEGQADEHAVDDLIASGNYSPSDLERLRTIILSLHEPIEPGVLEEDWSRAAADAVGRMIQLLKSRDAQANSSVYRSDSIEDWRAGTSTPILRVNELFRNVSERRIGCTFIESVGFYTRDTATTETWNVIDAVDESFFLESNAYAAIDANLHWLQGPTSLFPHWYPPGSASHPATLLCAFSPRK